jgi:hypothetical protein
VWWVRYAREKKLDDEEIADRLISYLDRLVDRHINKARGILPFNSILLAVFTFEANRFRSPVSVVADHGLASVKRPLLVYVLRLLAA